MPNLLVLLDPFSHHSTSLPFRELAARHAARVRCVEFGNIETFEAERRFFLFIS